MSIRMQPWWSKLSAAILVTIWAIFILIPLFVMVLVAIKTPAEQAVNPFGFPQHIAWNNFSQAWQKAHLARAILNSLILTIVAIFFIVIFSAMAAYPLARRTRWTLVFYYFLSSIMVPFQLAMLPLYRLMKGLHLINTYHGVIAIYIAVSLPMAVFLYAGFIKGVNSELEDAAMVDGASTFRMFWAIIFPLLKPITTTVVIMNIMSLWNDFFIVLLYMPKREMRTLQLAIFSFVGQYNSKFNLIMAAVMLSIAPIVVVFLILQRQFVAGIAGGAVKG